MAKFVIKRDGTKEPFDSEKIKNAIIAAAQDANLPEEKTNETADKVSKKILEMAKTREEIATSEIREAILSELDNIEPSVAEAWRKHDREKKGIAV